MIFGSATFERAVTQPFTPKLYGEVWIGQSKVGEVPIIGGSVSQSAGQFQRRSGSVTLPATREVVGMLHPGAMLRVWSGIEGVSGRGVPVLYGPIVKPSRKWGGSDFEVTVEDLSRRVLRDQFTTPKRSMTSASIANQILTLWRESIPWCKWDDRSGDTTTCPDITWEGDRSAAIGDLAAAIACETFMRPDGTVVLQRIPDVRAQPVMRVVSRENLSELTLSTDWDEVYNHVVVTADRGDGAVVRGEWVDETSATGIGRCGRSVKIINSDAVATNTQARLAAYGVVRRSQGLRVGYSYTARIHPGVEASDVHHVSAKGERTNRVVVDTVSFDLHGASVSVEGRLPATVAETAISSEG